MLHYLRIAVSVLCLIMCALLIALWVRSYYREDGVCLGVTDKRGFIVFSADGMLLVDYINSMGDQMNLSKWFVGSYPHGEAFWLPREATESAVFGFLLPSYPKGSILVVVPHWLVLIVSGGFAAVLHFKRSWRFSLRTLLITMTLIAIMLGLIFAFGR